MASKLTKKYRPGLPFIGNLLAIGCLLISSSFSTIKSRPYGVTTVVIDAGHGGHDSGCLGNNVKEKTVALGIALKLGKYIEEHFPDIKVIYTRKTDVFIELHERAAIANNARADLFICIHCNSACYFNKKKKKELCNEEILGAETWVMGLHMSEANLEVSKRENEVVLLEKDYTKQYDGFDPNSPEANIIFSLYQNTFLDQSLKMASAVQQELKSKGRPSRGVKQAGFLVLYKTAMPSILIETGFLSNPSEAKYLGSDKGQQEIAHGIYNAFKSYKSGIESSGIKQETTEIEQSSPTGDTAGPPTKKNINDAKNDGDTKPVVKDTQVAEVKPKDVEPVKDKTDAVESNTNENLSFGVQILISPTRIEKSSKKFKGLQNVREEKGNGVYKYITGDLASMNDAVNLQDEMRTKGFKDAFVVAFLNNKRISIKEAREMLKKK
ncbi:MAG TPA: N-acetylmuramoyl-L-alanine amidase [Bacteroidia bacterium]|nr:N-acetylmuramoyl-L-alanine amidase [Bacteroidia bacterium]